MVKLTTELVECAVQCTNSIKDRELDLRGYKINLLENLGATLDQFDTLDLSDNEIKKLTGFPQLKRLKAIVLHNNKVVRIAEGLEQVIPNLDTLILTNNNLQEVRDIDPLASLKRLEFLVLSRNPLTMKPNYRLYVIHKLPQVRILDYRRVRLRERDQAAAMFRGKRSTSSRQKERSTNSKAPALTGLPRAIVQPSRLDKASKIPGVTPTASAASSGTTTTARGTVKRAASASPQDLEAIRDAIKKAKTLDEVERLNVLLTSGNFAGFSKQQQDQPPSEESMTSASESNSQTAPETAINKD